MTRKGGGASAEETGLRKIPANRGVFCFSFRPSVADSGPVFRNPLYSVVRGSPVPSQARPASTRPPELPNPARTDGAVIPQIPPSLGLTQKQFHRLGEIV